MLSRATLSAALAACLVVLGGSCGTGPGVGNARAEWEDLMEDVIGPVYDDVLVPEAESDRAPMQFDRIAAEATRAADAMALGHGRLDWPEVPRFAALAGESEAWLRDIARLARAQDAAATRRTILDGELDHCDRCHAACR
ncbi:MAG: hypothetical protein O2865_15140 [Planctomycetota bacterium]|jgi:hypothetical protein|nr:hypothetical protein [Planctomycetota bacterium]